VFLKTFIPADAEISAEIAGDSCLRRNDFEFIF
jgi:hypothetical protein